MAQLNKSQLPDKLHVYSPLIESTTLSQHLKHRVLLKMDVLQPSGSFKIRGMSNLCLRKVKEEGCTRLISSSGGNAGIATAYCGRKLNIPVTVVVPESTPEMMRKKIEKEGAEVIVHGKAWDDANNLALQLVQQNPSSCLIHPFDHPYIWEGNSSIIDEIAQELKPKNEKPDVIVTVCGGGGLLCGLAQGLHKVGWEDVPILVSETDGAHSYNAAIKAGKLVTLPAITSVAKTLGAKTVCKEAFEWSKKHKIYSTVVKDIQAIKACLRFADEERCLIEPSCGAGLVCLYDNVQELKDILKDKPNSTIVVIICGGNAVTYPILKSLEFQLESEPKIN